MDKDAYLRRIGLADTKLKPDSATLRLLQRSHLLAVPFENLDIHWNRPIVIDTAKFYDKIVVEKRGGFCYELNGLFNELLRDLGFETRIVSARVYDDQGNFSPEYDHAAIIVTIGDEEYLTDVGFGAFTAEPLLFVLDAEQEDARGPFVIRSGIEDGYFEVAAKQDGGWRPEYMFQPQSRELSEFSGRCDFQQYAPDSHFRKGKLCSIMTEHGRKTLTDKSFIVTTNGGKQETAVMSGQMFNRILLEAFGIEPAVTGAIR